MLDKTLHEKFYENAQKTPENTALIYEGRKVSYGELSVYALRTANYLSRQGVHEGDKVAVILPRGVDQIAALLGILAIGAVYIPVSGKQPSARREKIIENVNPAITLQDETFLNETEKQWDGCIVKESSASAYIIYTSGSSGEPKGVEVSHAAAMNTITEVLRIWNIGTDDSVLNISSFDFDLSVFDIFGLLSAGGTVVLIDEKDYRDPEVWAELIETHGITIWNSAPALLDMFLILEKETKHFDKLRLALVSGDWIPLNLPDAWHTVTGSESEFVALGGATEGGIWSNYYCVSEVDSSWNSIPYGKALPGQKYKITDVNFKECNINTPGELWIGGESLAKGYVNDIELTGKKFVEDDAGERWYKTGDLGMYWEDGNIEFLGRIDTQVKIRGHRIELGEIESVLNELPEVTKAVVIARGSKYHKELAAFYSGAVFARTDVERHLKTRLPAYSIPGFIIKVDSFPLSENGKVDRKKLEQYETTDTANTSADESPDIVRNIWEELLGHRITDVNENLFKAGADSLLSARFVENLNVRYGIKVHMKDIFEKPTISELKDWVSRQKKAAALESMEEGEI